MDLPSALRSARLCQLCEKEFWVRPLSLDDWGILLAWIDDVVPGREERKAPPRFASEEAQHALYSRHGVRLLAWLALREQGVTPEVATELWEGASDEEQARLLSVLFGRRRTLNLDGSGDDIGDYWWGPTFSKIIESRSGFTFESIARMSLDQLDCLAAGVEDEDPVRETLIALDKMARENAAKRDAAQTETPANGETL